MPFKANPQNKNQTFSTGRVIKAVAVAAMKKTTRVYLKKENQLNAIHTNLKLLILDLLDQMKPL